MSKKLDLVGQRFGRLMVIREAGINKRQNTMWECLCDCGNRKIIWSASLKNGDTKSCGCLKIETLKKLLTIHGMDGTRFCNLFKGIKKRCNYSKDKNFYLYGGRGIKCLWNSFEEFRDDMYLSYQEHIKVFGEKNTTIDRIDNNGNYCKENCRWATWKKQRTNQRMKINFYTINNQRKCLKEWSKIYGINYQTLNSRIFRQKWPIEKALTIIPVRGRNQFNT